MSNPFEINGSALVAMKGKGCVAIAADRRLGMQLQTLSTNFQKVFQMQDNLLLGLAGLATDIQTFHALMEFKLNYYTLRENRPMKAETFSQLISTSLYEKRWGPYFVSPILAAIDSKGEPYISTYDSIGCLSDSEPFACSGTAGDMMKGLCESFYREDMGAEELEEAVAQILLSGMDRDILSGWGGIVYTMTKDKVTAKILKTKQC